jgi:hypothetical protein
VGAWFLEEITGFQPRVVIGDLSVGEGPCEEKSWVLKTGGGIEGWRRRSRMNDEGFGLMHESGHLSSWRRQFGWVSVGVYLIA